MYASTRVRYIVKRTLSLKDLYTGLYVKRNKLRKRDKKKTKSDLNNYHTVPTVTRTFGSTLMHTRIHTVLRGLSFCIKYVRKVY